MKNIVLIGGLGRVGKVLSNGLGNEYRFLIIDKNLTDGFPAVIADIANFDQLMAAIPEDTDVIIDLTAHKISDKNPGREDFTIMKETYVQGIYNVFEVARTKSIPKVIYASTGHVTGLDERSGLSQPGRKITTTDYPKPDGVYGAMKLFGESVARLYALHHGIKSVCLRLGVVTQNNNYAVKNKRNSRIFLYHEDLITIIKKAIESEIDFGIFYAVSENKEKPWSLKSLRKGLKLKRRDFVKMKNSSLLHKIFHKFRKVSNLM
jgi:nucleoside-diphosphate-sugar epimerase